jgi:ketosteroid isomerase-like protein
MKRMLLFAMLAVFSQVAVYSAQHSKAEQEIRKLDDQRIAAILKQDVPALDRLMADDFTYTHQGGVTETKAEFLGEMKAGQGAFTSLKMSEVKVRILGSAAVLTGRCDITAKRGGRDFAIPMHFTEVYSRTAGHWHWLLWQSTRLPAPPA